MRPSTSERTNLSTAWIRVPRAPGVLRVLGVLSGSLALAIAGCGADEPAPAPTPEAPIARAASDLVATLASSDPREVHAARRQLLDRGAEALPDLETGLESPDVAIRLGVVELLPEFGEPGIALLLRAALDADAQVRSRAVYRIGVMQADAGREVVENALGDEDVQVATAAAIACAKLCQTSYGFRRLGELAIRHPVMPVIRAFQLLAWRGDEIGDVAREALGEVGTEALGAPDADPERRFAAALVAGTAGRPEAIEPAAAALSAESVPERRLALMLALASIDDERAAAPVIAELATADPDERALACRIASHLGSRARAAADIAAHCESARPDAG